MIKMNGINLNEKWEELLEVAEFCEGSEFEREVRRILEVD